MPLMKKKFVEKLNWISEEEMLDFVSMAQSCPGAMAVNASLFVGESAISYAMTIKSPEFLDKTQNKKYTIIYTLSIF